MIPSNSLKVSKSSISIHVCLLLLPLPVSKERSSFNSDFTPEQALGLPASGTCSAGNLDRCQYLVRIHGLLTSPAIWAAQRCLCQKILLWKEYP